MWKQKEKRALRSPSLRSEDIIRMGLKEISCEDVDWIYLGQDKH
jgi:hypothetical protein